MTNMHRKDMLTKLTDPVPSGDWHIEDRKGLKLSHALRDLNKYWDICIRAKDVPNYVRYGKGEEAGTALMWAYSDLCVAVKRYNFNCKNKREGGNKLPYNAYDIVEMSREAEKQLELGVAAIRIIVDCNCFVQRLDELYRLISLCEGMMRGWLVYITSRGGRC